MDFKDKIKFIVFIEVLTYLIAAGTHLVFYLTGNDVSNYAEIYWIVPMIVLGITLLTIFIITPIADWWMK